MTNDWEGGTLEESGKLDNPDYRCKHGVYSDMTLAFGDPYRLDFMCIQCELGIDFNDEDDEETDHILIPWRAVGPPLIHV